ncbi:conserved hypothetical protein [Vibrio nigripulchritudo SOn1]|uniref:Transposase n=1 Tax=Vibrio nigripulchritudo SOn1 TaxID=1238450 RepID=A0AAV2VQQ3_9VIBR|nr:hypothetical protein [Vibrio nigripulchritudo]CCO46805.1 conserved hypothetical protein [Vibrio nigripulchritudo SOn1]
MDINLAILWIETVGDTYSDTAHVCTCDKPDEIERVSLRQLDPKYFYLANKRSNFFTKHPDIGQYNDVAHSTYFGIAVSSVAIELNLGDDLSEKMPVLLKVFSSLAQKLSTFKIDYSEQSFTVLSTIRDAICPNIGQLTYRLDGVPSQSLDNAIDNSLQKLQGNKHKKLKDERIVSAKPPKTPYFLHLTNQLYPLSTDYRTDNSFTGKLCGTDKNGQPVNEEVAKRLIALAKESAGMVQFEVISTDRAHQNVMPLGCELNTEVYRTWATLPELIDMLNYSELRLGAAYLTKAGKLPFFKEQPPADTPFMSFTNGLVNEVIWMALSYHSSKDKSKSPMAAYLRAYDRILSREKAMSLVKKGYRLTGFVSGTIRFAIKMDPHRIEQFSRELVSIGLIPQFELI